MKFNGQEYPDDMTVAELATRLKVKGFNVVINVPKEKRVYREVTAQEILDSC